jgi:hypothetical protein
MNATEGFLEKIRYEQNFKSIEITVQRTFCSAETVLATNTYQFEDYLKYETSGIHETE